MAKGSLDRSGSSHHVKMLKFDDQPQIKTYEIEPKSSLNEPNRHTTYRHEGFLHAAEQPLPPFSEIDLDGDASSMPKEPFEEGRSRVAHAPTKRPHSF